MPKLSLPRTVNFTPVEGAPGQFEMRQAKFFEDGQVFLDGVLPVLATVVSDKENEPRVAFPSSAKEAYQAAKLRESAAAVKPKKAEGDAAEETPSFLTGEL